MPKRRIWWLLNACATIVAALYGPTALRACSRRSPARRAFSSRKGWDARNRMLRAALARAFEGEEGG